MLALRVRAHFYVHGQKSRSWREACSAEKGCTGGNKGACFSTVQVHTLSRSLTFEMPSEVHEDLCQSFQILTCRRRFSPWVWRSACKAVCTDRLGCFHRRGRSSCVRLTFGIRLPSSQCIASIKIPVRAALFACRAASSGKPGGMGPVTYGVLLEFGFGCLVWKMWIAERLQALSLAGACSRLVGASGLKHALRLRLRGHVTRIRLPPHEWKKESLVTLVI